MKKTQIITLLVSILTFFLNQKTFAEAPPPTLTTQNVAQAAAAAVESENPKLEDLKALDYPELQVVPRASERLILEAGAVRDKGVMLLFPYVASSVMTLASGVVVSSSLKDGYTENEKNDILRDTKLAMGVGAAGIALAYWYTNADPYGATLNQIRAFKNKDRRTELLKERLAEESFEKSATLLNQWKWVYAATNFVASAQLIDKSKGDNNLVPILSTVASLLPLFITTSYETNYQKQLEYKRRIYVPLTWFDYQYNSTQLSWQPQINAVWRF